MINLQTGGFLDELSAFVCFLSFLLPACPADQEAADKLS